MNNKISKDQKYNLQITLLLIRETFRMLYYSSNKKTPLKKNNPVEKMYISLGITPKILQNFIFTDSKKIPDEIKNSCTILESIGFPSNLMNGEKPLTMSNKLLCSLYDYFFQSNDLDVSGK